MAQQSQKLDALQMLADDHRTVENLFEKFENARSGAVKQKLVRQICEELTIHAMIEEQVFYPSVRDLVESDMMDEAQVEHDSAKTLIMSLREADPDDPFFEAKVSVLREQVEHHVYEEERQRGSIFSQVRKSDVDLEQLGEEMAALKQRLKQQAQQEGLPEPVPVSFTQ